MTPIEEIRQQRERNHVKWGDRSIEARPPGYRGWLPTLGEEFGEVCRAQTLEEGDIGRLRAELIDLAAVALMWIDSIDRAAEVHKPFNDDGVTCCMKAHELARILLEKPDLIVTVYDPQTDDYDAVNAVEVREDWMSQEDGYPRTEMVVLGRLP